MFYKIFESLNNSPCIENTIMKLEESQKGIMSFLCTFKASTVHVKNHRYVNLSDPRESHQEQFTKLYL